jgi:hypothetical protein
MKRSRPAGSAPAVWHVRRSVEAAGETEDSHGSASISSSGADRWEYLPRHQRRAVTLLPFARVP